METCNNALRVVQPFGSVDANNDPILFDSFMRVRHVVRALDPSVSVVTGRRAAGKTALALYLAEGREIPFDVVVHFPPQELLGRFLFLQMSARDSPNASASSTSLTSDQIEGIWHLKMWQRVAKQLSRTESFMDSVDAEKFSLVQAVLEGTVSEVDDAILGARGDPCSRDLGIIKALTGVDALQESPEFWEFRRMLAAYLATHRLLVVADSIEDYRIRNELVDRALAGMLMAMTSFASGHLPNLQVKCLFPSEIYSYLKVDGPLRFRTIEQHRVHLRWSMEELRTLLSHRVAGWLNARCPDLASELSGRGGADIESWVWSSLFPVMIRNVHGVEENTFLFIARHTQLHPGQLIWICNAILERAADEGRFPPSVDAEDVVAGMREMESRIALSILVPYSAVYPGIVTVLKAALSGSPNLMATRDFERLYERTRDAVPPGGAMLDRQAFQRMALESGVVGKLVKETDRYYIARFEHDTGERLAFSPGDMCAVHPAFYNLLEVDTSGARKFVCPEVLGL